MSDQVGNPEDRFSHNEAQIMIQANIIPLIVIAHCIATWYSVFRYLIKLTELEISWGRSDTVT